MVSGNTTITQEKLHNVVMKKAYFLSLFFSFYSSPSQNNVVRVAIVLGTIAITSFFVILIQL